VNEQTRLSLPTHAVPFTAGDFLRMMELGAFADMRAELVGGVIEKMMPADWTHGELNARVSALIYPFARRAGARVGTDVVLRIDDTTVRALDIVVVRPDALPAKMLDASEVLLGVEIAETTHARDLGDKREEYGRAGIPDYWVVDCLKQVTHCFRLNEAGDGYGPARLVPFDQPLDLPGLDASVTID
jgi:Uma2 family endonuclease